MANDKPTVQFSLAKLRKEVKEVEPFSIALSGSKIITFPDLNAMESEESDELLDRLESPGKNTWAVLDDWLSKDDAKALRAEKLSRAELIHVVATASNYYKGEYGDLGEGTASAS